MTLWLQPIDYARSSRPWLERLSAHVPAGACLLAPGANTITLAALEYTGRYRIDARPASMEDLGCHYLLRVAARGERTVAASADWIWIADVQRPRDREELTTIYRRR